MSKWNPKPKGPGGIYTNPEDTKVYLLLRNFPGLEKEFVGPFDDEDVALAHQYRWGGEGRPIRLSRRPPDWLTLTPEEHRHYQEDRL